MIEIDVSAGTLTLFGIFGALISLGATVFWNIQKHSFNKICRVEEKVDHIIENMVSKAACHARHQEMTKQFNSHQHVNGDLVIVRRQDDTVYERPEEVPGAGNKPGALDT